MYKLVTSSRDSDDFYIGFDRDCHRRRYELLRDKNIDGKYPLRFTLKDVFGFPEHQQKALFRLGYNLTLAGNKD